MPGYDILAIVEKCFNFPPFLVGPVDIFRVQIGVGLEYNQAEAAFLFLVFPLPERALFKSTRHVSSVLSGLHFAALEGIEKPAVSGCDLFAADAVFLVFEGGGVAPVKAVFVNQSRRQLYGNEVRRVQFP